MSDAQELIRFGKAAAAEHLFVSTCGNGSLRIGDRFLVSASGAELGDLAGDEVAVVSIEDGAHLDGPKPSVEAEMHRQIYLARPQIGAVLHCQSRAATVLACERNPPVNLDYIPEIPAYIRKFAYVDYRPPGGGDLAGMVGAAFQDTDVTIVQMRNHGQTIGGATWTKVIRRAVFFELACWMSLNGRDLITIPSGDAGRLRELARDA